MNKYINRRLEDIVKINEELADGRFDYAMIVAHRLKGHGNTFGYPEISECGKELEHALKENDLENSIKIIKKLDQLVNSYNLDL